MRVARASTILGEVARPQAAIGFTFRCPAATRAAEDAPVRGSPGATSIQYAYHVPTGTTDPWTSPFEDEQTTLPLLNDSRRAQPSPQVTFPTRMTSQSFAYDWLGNLSSSDDDAHGFYDRSLGTITKVPAAPYQLQRATRTGTRGGTLRPTYDAAGNTTALFVARSGPCNPISSGCNQSYRYEWDELGRLSRARRWDYHVLNVDSPPNGPPVPAAVDLAYAYDADDERVIKTSTDFPLTQHHTVYVFDSLELRRAQYTGLGNAADYTLSTQTEVPYLFANGVRLARVVYEPNSAGVPASSSVANQHVFFELGDHLGSTSTVLDKDTGELVERSTYQAYGAAESDYRPDRWDAFREDYRFTGKEEDVEVGLTYFGKRFYSANLGRWMSPDPLGLHDAGKGDLNLYAYVSGQALKAVDPLGLCGEDGSGGCSGGGGAEGAPSTAPGEQVAPTPPPAKSAPETGPAYGLFPGATVERGIIGIAIAVFGSIFSRPAPGGPKDMTATPGEKKAAATPAVPETPKTAAGAGGGSDKPPGASPPAATPDEPGKRRTTWKPGPNDADWRGSGRGVREALGEAFKRTGVSREKFEVTKWGKDANGKSFPTEWRAPGGAEVNIDEGHVRYGPSDPHVGWQTPGLRAGGGAMRGHIILDAVPVSR